MFNLFSTLARMNSFLVSMHRLLKITFLVPSDAVAVKANKFTLFDPIDLASESWLTLLGNWHPYIKAESTNWLPQAAVYKVHNYDLQRHLVGTQKNNFRPLVYRGTFALELN